MLRRITLLAPAPTASQRAARFPRLDDEIERLDGRHAAAVRRALGEPQHVVGGSELRVAQTADALGLALDARAELTAWCPGAWAGRRVTDVAAADPAGFEAWRTDPASDAPGRESLLALLDRGARWLAERSADGRTLAIADSSVIRALVVHILGAPPEAFWRIDVAPLSTTVLHGEGTMWRVRSLGEGPARSERP